MTCVPFLQLDEARRPDEEKEESSDQQPDIAPEDNAIEMSDDFDAKPQDLEPVGKWRWFMGGGVAQWSRH